MDSSIKTPPGELSEQELGLDMTERGVGGAWAIPSVLQMRGRAAVLGPER